MTDETRGLLDARRLALLRDGAAVINTARGAIVDEEALVRELTSGRLRAGLDVFVHEPNVPEALLGLPNVVLQPHVGSATRATREAATAELVANIEAVLRRSRAAEPRPGLGYLVPGGPVAQRIERRTSNPRAEVRLLPGPFDQAQPCGFGSVTRFGL